MHDADRASGGLAAIKFPGDHILVAEKNDLASRHPDIAKQLGDFMAEAMVAPRSQKDDGKYTGRPPRKKPKR